MEVTAEKMKECVWVRTELLVHIEFLEWTDADHLRHSKFMGLREDKDASQVVKEGLEERTGLNPTRPVTALFRT